jgi:hypothetical protein
MLHVVFSKEAPSETELGAVLGAVLLLLASCANPVSPSGGPRDETPPRIATSRPAAEATDVSGRTVQILFNEYVEQESLREALSVTPRPAGRLEFDWNGRSVDITFPEPFRDSTTYLLTIDKALKDVREGTALEQPILLAFSTGTQIDRGRLAGRVVGNRRGAPREGLDVYAYAASVADSARLPEAPLYRTQTGPEGTFAFAYLREDRRYYVVALRDRNRNRRPDPLEAFATPPRPSFPARIGDSTAAPLPAADTSEGNAAGGSAADTSEGNAAGGSAADTSRAEPPFVVGNEDAVPPRLTRALPLSQRRLAVRFSEPIRLRTRAPGRFALTDTTTGRPVAVRSVYRRPGEGQRLTLRTAPMRPTGHRVRLMPGPAVGPAVTDTSGNAPERPAEAAFTATERADTLALRLLRFGKGGPAFPAPDGGDALALAPGQTATVVFNQPPGSSGDSTSAQRLVSARDTATGDALPIRLETDDGTTYRVAFDPPLAPGQVARLRVDGRRFDLPADTVYTRLLRRLPDEALGAVSGVVRIVREQAASDTSAADTSGTSPVFVELYAAGEAAEGAAGEAVQAPLRTTRAGSDGRFLFENLPEANYRFRAFLDRDADGQWDLGSLAPYRPPEPLAWSRRPVESRPRWETATEDTLRISNRPF